MKLRLKWVLMTLAVALIAAGAARTLIARQAKADALKAQQVDQQVQATVMLTPADLVQARIVTLRQSLPIAGPLKAVNSAMIKARVAGELQGLTVREGDFVKAGQIIARIDATEFQARVRQAQQQAESAKAQVVIAQRSFDNNHALVAQGFISKTALESSTATLAGAQASYQAALAGIDVATKALGDTVVRSPIAGQVAQRLTQVGERVSIDARIVEIVDLSVLEMEAALSAADSLAVHVGQTAQLSVDASPADLHATVVRINPSALAASRAVLAYLALDSSANLRQGLFVKGTLMTGTTTTLAAPLSAVRTDKPQPYVQLVHQGKVSHQVVELGARGDNNGELMVALKGVAQDATLLGGSIGTLRNGTPVRVETGAP